VGSRDPIKSPRNVRQVDHLSDDMAFLVRPPGDENHEAGSGELGTLTAAS
jgi:hypothetical protein